MAISTLAYKITADTKQFTSNVQLTRRELNLTKRVMQETASPADKLKSSLQQLEKLYEAGAIDARQLALAQAKVRSELGAVDTKAAGLKGTLGNFPSIFRGMIGPVTSAAGAFSAFALATSTIRKNLKELDELAKTSARLNIDPNNLRALQLLASFGGIDQSTLESGLERLSRVTGGAALGRAGDVRALTEAGFSREDLLGLSDLSLTQQLLQVTQRIRQLPKGQQIAAASTIFGRTAAEPFQTLGITPESFAAAFETIEQKRGLIDPGKIEELNDKMTEQTQAIAGMGEGFTAEFVKAADALGSAVGAVARQPVSGQTIGRAFGQQLFGGGAGRLTTPGLQAQMIVDALRRANTEQVNAIKKTTDAVKSSPTVVERNL